MWSVTAFKNVIPLKNMLLEMYASVKIHFIIIEYKIHYSLHGKLQLRHFTALRMIIIPD